MSEPEFSRIVRLDGLPPGGLEETLSASEAERGRLVERFGFLSIGTLTAETRVLPVADGARLDATLVAEIEQACVVTLEPVRTRIEHRFLREYRLAPPGMTPESALDTHTSDSEDGARGEEDEDFDWIFDGKIDIGDAVAEELALAADPYPRAADADLETVLEGRDTGAPEHPFAALAKLKAPNRD